MTNTSRENAMSVVVSDVVSQFYAVRQPTGTDQRCVPDETRTGSFRVAQGFRP